MAGVDVGCVVSRVEIDRRNVKSRGSRPPSQSVQRIEFVTPTPDREVPFQPCRREMSLGFPQINSQVPRVNFSPSRLCKIVRGQFVDNIANCVLDNLESTHPTVW